MAKYHSKKILGLMGAVDSKTPKSEVEGWLRLLSTTERNILLILYHSKSPRTTKEARSKYIDKIVSYLEVLRDPSKGKLPAFIIEPKEGCILDDRTDKLLKKIWDARKKLSYSRWIEFASALISKEAKYETPSYWKIDMLLKSLEKQNLVLKKPSEQRGIKAFYILNPKFYAFLKDNKIDLAEL